MNIPVKQAAAAVASIVGQLNAVKEQDPTAADTTTGAQSTSKAESKGLYHFFFGWMFTKAPDAEAKNNAATRKSWSEYLGIKFSMPSFTSWFKSTDSSKSAPNANEEVLVESQDPTIHEGKHRDTVKTSSGLITGEKIKELVDESRVKLTAEAEKRKKAVPVIQSYAEGWLTKKHIKAEDAKNVVHETIEGQLQGVDKHIDAKDKKEVEGVMEDLLGHVSTADTLDPNKTNITIPSDQEDDWVNVNSTDVSNK